LSAGSRSRLGRGRGRRMKHDIALSLFRLGTMRPRLLRLLLGAVKGRRCGIDRLLPSITCGGTRFGHPGYCLGRRLLRVLAGRLRGRFASSTALRRCRSTSLGLVTVAKATLASCNAAAAFAASSVARAEALVTCSSIVGPGPAVPARICAASSAALWAEEVAHYQNKSR
jgi:hypothetical protein